MARRFAPGVPDVVFGLVLVSVLLGGRYRLLNDPGTFWHLRLGRDILKTGVVPRVDGLTYTRGGEAWVDQSWLFDVGLAAVVDHAGWSGAGLLAGLGIAAVYGFLARGLVRDGGAPIVVLMVAMLAAGVGSIHFLVRPHLVTLGLVLATLRLCQRQHEAGGWRIWVVPLFMPVWANMHGGFLAGPLIVFTAGFGHAVSGDWDKARKRDVLVFCGAGLACLLAALLNPYGIGLYGHVGRLLVSSGVTELIEEYQPIPFGKPDARAVEMMVLAMVALPTILKGRMSRYELAHALVWLHLSLGSVRHAPLFALAGAPGLVRLLGGVREGNDGVCREMSRWSVWPGIAALGLGVWVMAGGVLTGFDGRHWPLRGMEALNDARGDLRLFHEQDWGGMVEAESRPARLAFLDDRFELYGKEAILRYLNALEGGPEWDAIREKEGIGLVWVRPGRGLARRLGMEEGWKVRYRDEVSVLFEREGEKLKHERGVLAAGE